MGEGGGRGTGSQVPLSRLPVLYNFNLIYFSLNVNESSYPWEDSLRNLNVGFHFPRNGFPQGSPDHGFFRNL